MIVISDTSCISNLLTIHRVDLLPVLFGEVIIPPAVEMELRRFHEQLPGFLKVLRPTDEVHLLNLCHELDVGEAEAICLARELGADRLLFDERRGREIALREGLRIIGVVGILVLAKRKGLVTSVATLLDHLEQEAGFRLSPVIKATALREGRLVKASDGPRLRQPAPQIIRDLRKGCD